MANVATTWAQLIQQSRDGFEAGIRKQWLETWDVLGDLPILTNGSLSVKWKEESLLPTVGTRKLNATFSDFSQGGSSDRSMALPIYGGYLDIDHQYLTEPGGAEEMARQLSLKNRAFAYRMAYDVIYGDTGVDPEGMDGIKVWVANSSARNTITASLDLTTSALRATNAAELVRIMHTGVVRMRQGTGKGPDLILMDDDLFILIADAMRQSGFLKTDMDSQDREINRFMGAKIHLGGYQADQSTALIGANHDGDGKTSMYFLRTGAEYTHLIQKHALRTVKLGSGDKEQGTTDDGIWVRRMLEWPVSLRVKHKYGALRIKTIDITP
jgi:hypothetical protein